MSHHDKLDSDGIRDDGVPYTDATDRLHVYTEARQQLTSFEEPVLLHADNPHECLFVAGMDGTNNDMVNDPEHITNVGQIVTQIWDKHGPYTQAGYVPGPGTQQDAPFTKIRDTLTGYTVEQRAEEMYRQFIEQAWKWKQQDPHAQIHVVSVAFSRGAEVGALFSRVVEDRGIQDPTGAHYTYNSQHQIAFVKYDRPALVGAHEVAQAVALFDPVSTGRATNMDRRLPPSVISGIQLTALDEHRSPFKSDRIIDPGITPDGRFAGVELPGAHSDVGGGYHRDGLAIRAGNVVIDFVNGFGDRKILEKVIEPDDPRLNMVHDSRKAPWLEGLVYFFTPRIDRLEAGSYVTREVPRSEVARVPDAYNAEPRNEALSRQFERQPMPDGPEPAALAQMPEATQSAFGRWLNQLYAAAQDPDNGAWDQAQHEAAKNYLCTPDGYRFQQQANELNQAWDMRQAAQRAQQRALQQAQQQPQGLCL